MNRWKLPAIFAQRRITGVGLLLTLAMLLYAALAGEPMLEWLRNDYGLTREHFLIGYAAALVVMCAAFVFEPVIRAELQALGVFGAAVIALVTIIAATSLLIPDQQFRVFRPVPLLYLTVAYAIMLAAGVILLALRDPDGAPSHRLIRYSVITAAIASALMIVLAVVSVGRFHPLDDVYDEFMMGSNMTSYASHGVLAPSLLNEVYGDPDPVTPRYYLLGGLWLRLIGDQSLTGLRSWSMLAGMIGAGLMLIVLWRAHELSRAARVIGFALLVSSMAFTRTAHNLRMDIGLLTYSALMLLLYLEAERAKRPRALIGWMFAAGLAVLIGLEAHITIGLTIGVSYGLTLILRTAVSPDRREMILRRILPYAIGAAVGCTAHLIIHLSPDPAHQLEMLSLHGEVYVAMGSISQGVPLRVLPSVFGFELGLSPIEFFVIIGVMIAAVVIGDSRVRWLAITAGIALMIQWGILSSAFNYHIAYMPIVVYCAAALLRKRAALALAAFVVIPALAFTSGRDMAVAAVENRNGQRIAELALSDWRFPDGARIVGSDIFWIVLQQRTDFTGTSGLRYIGNRYDIDAASPAILEYLHPDFVICTPGLDTFLCDAAAAYFATEPAEFAITDATYLIYSANPP